MFMRSLVPPGVEGPRPGTARDRPVCGPAPVLAGRRVLRLSIHSLQLLLLLLSGLLSKVAILF